MPAAIDIAWVGSAAMGCALLVALLWIAPAVADWFGSGTGSVFPEWQWVIRPERLETVRVAFVLLAPFVVAAIALAGAGGPGERRFEWPIVVAQLLAVALLIVGISEQTSGPYLGFPLDYFEPLLLGVPVLVSGAICGLVLAALVWARLGPLRDLGRRVRAAPHLDWALAAIATVLTMLWLLPAVFTDANISLASPVAHSHIHLQAADYFAVATGRTPLVDYIGQYAHLLPLLTAPVIGGFDLSYTAFTVTMAALSCAALLCIYAMLRIVTGRAWAALGIYLPFLALSLFPWSRQGDQWDFNGNYFAVLPDRYLGPFVVAVLLALVASGRRVPTWLPFFVAGLTVLNNPEFGLPCLVALAIGLLLVRDGRPSLGARAKALALPALAGLAASVALVTTVLLIRSGELPHLEWVTYYSRQFGASSYGLVPMPTLGLHLAVYATFAGALITAAVRHVGGSDDRGLSALLAFSGTLGLLTGGYFGGRSLPWQLMAIFPLWGLSLSLLAWTALLHLSRADRGPIAPRNVIPVLAVLAGFGVMVAAIATIPRPWGQVARLGERGPPLDEPVSAVQSVTDPGETVLLLGSSADHRLAERAGVVNASPWNGGLSLFSASETERALEQLEREGGTKVILRSGIEGVIGPSGSATRLILERGYRPVPGDPGGELTVLERGQ